MKTALLDKLPSGPRSLPAFFASVVRLFLSLVPAVFLLTGRGKFCACLLYAVSAVPRPPRTAGVLVYPFFPKQETFPLCREMLRRGVQGVRERNLPRSTLMEEKMTVTKV